MYIHILFLCRGGNEVTQNQEIEQLLQAQREVVDMISDDAIRLEEVSKYMVA